MHPHTDTAEQPAPELEAFADVMRSVLRTRHDSPGDGPEALETWGPADGYCWRWTSEEGQWRVAAGEVVDPRPLLHGPGGIWRTNVAPEHAGDLVLLMLRAAGAIPADDVALVHPRLVRFRRGGVRVRGQHFVLEQPDAEPRRALVLRPDDPAPVPVPEGYVVVRATVEEPDEHGRWEVTLPDGYHRHVYDPSRRCLVPVSTENGGTELLLFEPDQHPGRVFFLAGNVSRGAA